MREWFKEIGRHGTEGLEITPEMRKELTQYLKTNRVARKAMKTGYKKKLKLKRGSDGSRAQAKKDFEV
tara:strand:- start:935 stop:1138 length:204 start_codon:yes stop_codon:yes gene_type:complete